MPADVSISASPPESSNSRFQRPSAAITRRASARSGVTSAADLFEMPRLAHRDRDRQRLHLGIGGFDHGEIFHAARDLLRRCRARASRRCHCAVAFDGRIASETSTSRPCSAGIPKISTSPRLMPNRSSSACIAYCGWLDAGDVVNLPCASLMPPIDCHASSSRSVSSPGSTTAPCGQGGDRVEEFRGRRHRTGRARRDHRAVMMRGRGARLPPRSGGRAAPPARSSRFPAR